MSFLISTETDTKFYWITSWEKYQLLKNAFFNMSMKSTSRNRWEIENSPVRWKTLRLDQGRVHNQGANLNHDERQLAEWIIKRIPADQRRIMKIFSIHQRKYRYYKKTIDITKTLLPRMKGHEIMTIFSSTRSINT